MSFHVIRRQITIGVTSVAAIVAAATITRPVFLGRAPVVAELLDGTAPGMALAPEPWLTLPPADAVGTSRFLADRQAFAFDLMRTGLVTRDRAWHIADVAVREAYTRKVPPALVLGVMLTENDQLKSTAMSRVGAVGLMQVHPKPWRVLEKLFGANLKTDSTNLKYGIFILGHLATEVGKKGVAQEEGWRTALLRYNGCVRGTNTPNCHRYPDVVRANVQRAAHYSCRQLNFTACVIEPLWLAKGTGSAAAD